ncbi:hypothetical protein [Actibacterium ureilyticum]|uniref:hypothetical protein n=1 Tax=Actibacterium ureilyticum TaxID=1590614 RepID=UPI001595E8A1|nr:hypothetical protein [Actibacterium ureilyticum]
MCLRCLLVVVWICLPLAAQAQDPDAGWRAVSQSLPEEMLKKIRKSPDRFMEDAAELILGFGLERGIDADGIEDAIMVLRARVRAREMRRMLLADLDNDGTVTRAEISVLIPTEAAGRRARVMLDHMWADLDQDGRLTFAELRAHADAVALEAFSEKEAERLRGFIQFDLDGNGRVALDEIDTVVRELRRGA